MPVQSFMKLCIIFLCIIVSQSWNLRFSSNGVSNVKLLSLRDTKQYKKLQMNVNPKSDRNLVSHSLEKVNSVHMAPYKMSRNNFAIPLVITTAISLLFCNPVQAATIFETIQDRASSSGFAQSFLLIFISEIGDKTFFIAALLAAKYGRFISFVGSIGALAVMTLISTVIGQLFHAVPSSLTKGIPFDDYIAVLAFGYFGIKTLVETVSLKDNEPSSIEEEKNEAIELVEEVATDEQKRKSAIALILQVFSLVFAAEIGDRSFLSTIGEF